MTLEVATRQSDRGGGADNGDDRLWATRLGDSLLAVLADGAGGMPGGAEAAQAFVDFTKRQVLEGTVGTTATDMCALLGKADTLIEDSPHAGETTAIIALITGRQLVGASVGDSEAWILRGSDHQALTAGQRKKRLGSGRAHPVRFDATLRAEARLLLGSDGLFGFAKPAAIVTAAMHSPLSAAAGRVLTSARMSNGNFGDDVSVVLIG